ncbi:unnamed protein product, partial [Polarella glacialis]
MESFSPAGAMASSQEERKYEYSMVGHSGSGPEAELLVPWGKPPRSPKEQLDIVKRMAAHAQYSHSGDHTLAATDMAIKDVLKSPADEYYVFVVSDADLARYGITPQSWNEILMQDQRVNAYVLLISSNTDEAETIKAGLTPGHGFVCENNDMLAVTFLGAHSVSGGAHCKSEGVSVLNKNIVATLVDRIHTAESRAEFSLNNNPTNDTKEWSGAEFSANVLTSGLWPTQPPSRAPRRSVRWAPTLGQCVLRASFQPGSVRKELVVSHFQAMVLLLFNSADSLTSEEMAAASHIPVAELHRTLQSLSLHKTVKLLLKGSKGREVATSDQFSFNAEFSHKMYRITVSQISAKEQIEEEATLGSERLRRVLKLLLRRMFQIFAPDVFLRQLAALASMIALRQLLWYARRCLRSVFRSRLFLAVSLSDKARRKNELRDRRRRCTDYVSFQRVGEKLDKEEGLDQWKCDDDSPYFDGQRLRDRTQKYRDLMAAGDVEGCMYALRGELLRKHFGICNPALFDVCATGTKVVVEQYIATVCE